MYKMILPHYRKLNSSLKVKKRQPNPYIKSPGSAAAKGLLCLAMILTLSLISGCTSKKAAREETEVKTQETSTSAKVLAEQKRVFKEKKLSYNFPAFARIDTVISDTSSRIVEIRFNKDLSQMPFRDSTIREMRTAMKEILGREFSGYTIKLKAGDTPLESLVPNYYREDKNTVDHSRLPSPRAGMSVVRNIDRPFAIRKGLAGRNIGLWHSHGWFYSVENKRWEWQRPRLFETVEDLVPASFILPYLVPMLENAGAGVFVPRERDIQKNMAIADNDNKTSQKDYSESSRGSSKWQTSETPGFAIGQGQYTEGVNPFKLGTSRFIQADTLATASAEWIPDIPSDGEYSVYISYQTRVNSATDAQYTVFHLGGSTSFAVNQQSGGSTWIYLGKFKFAKGRNSSTGKVQLTNQSSNAQSVVSADAVRFGGGMSNVSREGRFSGRPRFVEGARYNMQFSGMPDTLIFDLSNKQNDYNDDYLSRSEYINYLNGAPSGPNKDRSNKGLGIPIDLSLSFHTDAGITKNDTTVGSLIIYSTEDFRNETTLPDGTSRMVSRDLADIMQTQIVEDIRQTFDPKWKRRQIRDAKYSEAVRPNVPAVLLELLSHQNYLDMQFMQDPRFRFTVARAIYKAMLKFISFQQNKDFAVEPLPVTHFSAMLNGDGSATLRWRAKPDALEASATPTGYVVYTRTENGGFDNGQYTASDSFVVRNLKPGVIYSFRVAAVNDGGESFPSEILSVCQMNKPARPVLIVNAFDRICAPSGVQTDKFTGFTSFLDAGVPDRYQINFTGAQYDFDPSSQFITNDAPGHGASHADHEGSIIAGNSFDYAFIHGNSIRSCGYSFSSCSDESVWDNMVSMNSFGFADIIMGEEKETPWQRHQMDSLYGKQFKCFPDNFKTAISSFLHDGGNLFISGAYVASDLFAGKTEKDPDVIFGREVLRINAGADHASARGLLMPSAPVFKNGETFGFNTILNDSIYAVESAGEVLPEKGAETVLRYSENEFSAAVAYKKDYGVMVFGFPFETVLGQQQRNKLMNSVFAYFRMK